MAPAAGMQKKRWVVSPQSPAAAGIARALRISPLLAQVLVNRGLGDSAACSSFLNPRLSDLLRPDLLPGAPEAADRIIAAVHNREKITIYGDYDVDGITGVAILWQLLTRLGADVDYYIPHRVEEGYGLNEEALRSLAQAGTKLVITVDCGISALNCCRLAEQLPLELIITDHHEIGSRIPNVSAVVHPGLDESYGNPDSAGAMVAFKLAWAIADRLNNAARLSDPLRRFMLDATTLAAMGTIADVVDLRGENRILAGYGLKALAGCRLPGIRALIESAGLAGRGLDSYDIGFRLAPMLNAAGRMGHARLAVELLTSNNDLRCAEIAEYLKQQNQKRRWREKQIYEQACEMVSRRGLDRPEQKSLVLASADWHTGIIGIVASRIAETFHRPTIMINVDSPRPGLAQGSGRSIPGFSLLAGISACSRCLLGFGGHRMAAGISIESEKIELFAEQFENYARRHLNEEDVAARLHIDAVTRLSDLNIDTANQLRLLEPFGQGNPRPIFASLAVHLAAPPRKVGANGDHLQLALSDNTGAIRCIGFRFGALEKKLLEQDYFDVAYNVQINEYNGNRSVELVLVDVRFD